MSIKFQALVWYSCIGFCCTISINSRAQDAGLLTEFINDSNQRSQKITAAFNSTRVIHSQSIEMLSKNSLDVRILHRFGEVDLGIKELFGLDQASMRMGFDYGISNNLTIGFGRSTYRKEYDLLFKLRVASQSEGIHSMPVTIILTGGTMIRTADEIAQNGYRPNAVDRTSFYGQVLIGRKFNSNFSFQLIQTLLHMNFVPTDQTANTIYAVGPGARLKLSPRLSLTADYTYIISRLPDENYNPLSLGLDIETGGHVFQLHFSNTQGMNERAFISETTGNFFNGDIRFGFNLSRMFQLGRRE